jgi:murein DD-endopeptidase MepM/ murein hydrolase activator NlpD
MANRVASQPGYKEFMTMPLISKIMAKTPAEKQEEKQQKTPQQTLGALLTGGQKNQQNKKQDKPQTKTSGDPDRSKVSPGEDNPIRRNESEADVLAKTYILMRKHQKWVIKKEKEDKKYRKSLNNQKEAFLEETIEALTGKKTTSGKKSPNRSRLAGAVKKSTSKSGFLKYGFMAAAGVGGLLVAKDALANINWDKKFKDTFADFKFPEFDLKDMNVGTGSTSAVGGAKAGNWKNDTEFMNKVNKFADEKVIKASDLLAVMASESGMDPSIKNPKSKAVGLIQFMPKTAGILGTSTEELEKMTRSEQFEYVKKFFDKTGGLKQGATAGDMYAQMYLPSRKNDAILTKEGESYYESNKEFDVGKKGYITKEDLQQRAERKKKEFFIEDVQTTKTEKTASKTTPVVPNIAGIDELTKFTAYNPEFAREHNTFGAKRPTHSHQGIDLGRTEGAPVIARETGTVVGVGSQRGYGYTVLLDHGNGLQTFYAHLKEEPNLERGQIIKRGEAFAKVGRTTGANGEVDPKMVPHLHLELRKNGKAVDPEEWNIKQSKMIMEERQTNEANLKKETKSKSNDKQVSILNNNTNIIGGGTTYLISQENVSTYSPVTQQQFNYLS